jgi:hypothetical protein
MGMFPVLRVLCGMVVGIITVQQMRTLRVGIACGGSDLGRSTVFLVRLLNTV